jgi:hypothetical protein
MMTGRIVQGVHDEGYDAGGPHSRLGSIDGVYCASRAGVRARAAIPEKPHRSRQEGCSGLRLELGERQLLVALASQGSILARRMEEGVDVLSD